MFTPSERAIAAGGQPIADLMSRALGNPHLISLAAGFVDQSSLPVETMRVATEKVLGDPQRAQTALQYGENAGLPLFRDLILSRLRQADDLTNHPLTTQNVVVTAGSNQLLNLIAEVLLDPGDIALCAAPSYLVWTGVVKGVGARSLGIATDDQGLIPEALDAELARLESIGELERVKLIYVIPYFDNPRGISMPAARRAAVVEIAQRWSKHHPIHVLSDNAYRELRYRGDDIPDTITHDSMLETVIVAGTFSKSFAPGIRLGYGVLPAHLVGPVTDIKSNIDFGSPCLNQHIMAEVISSGLYDAQVHRVCDNYQHKLQVMLSACDEHLSQIDGVHWVRPDGGLYVWVELPASLDAGSHGELFEVALREGVFYVPGECCFAAEGAPSRPNSMRLSFGVQSPERIRTGIAALARAIDEVARRQAA